MEIRKISEQVYVSGQVTPADLSELRKLGLKSVICNRPDGEQSGQPTYEKISEAAESLGIEARYIPVAGAEMRGEDVAAFGQALAEMPRPVLAYCRSGARSAMLWSLVNENSVPTPGSRMH
ncbi:MAG: TIGR01244 family phosphatase [Silicimonas sp.]|nr:TIGR01244 family phosphatase [Silicimonas sp.]